MRLTFAKPPACLRALHCLLPLPAASESSGLPVGQRGTYAGLAAKVDHLKELGINAGKLVTLHLTACCAALCSGAVHLQYLTTPAVMQGLLGTLPPQNAAVYVCAVELLPVFEYDELEFQRRCLPACLLTACWLQACVVCAATCWLACRVSNPVLPPRAPHLLFCDV